MNILFLFSTATLSLIGLIISINYHFYYRRKNHDDREFAHLAKMINYEKTNNNS
jgi:hypothetical protein